MSDESKTPLASLSDWPALKAEDFKPMTTSDLQGITDAVWPVSGSVSINPNLINHSIIFYRNGVKIVEIGPDMQQGNIDVTNDYIRTLLERSPTATQAAFTIVSAMSDQTTVETLRNAMNQFFVGLLNEFHKDITARTTGK